MALSKFKNSGSTGELSFFKPAEHLDAVALIVEPREFSPNHTIGGYTHDRIFGKITIFDTEAMLDAGKATVLENATFNQSALVNDAKEYLPINGEAQQIAVTVERRKGKDASKNAYYVFEEVSDEIRDKVVQYLDEREATLKAAAAGMPDFT